MTSEKLKAEIWQGLLQMDLKEFRGLAGKTQEELAALAKMSQSQISQVEKRADHKLSTIRHIVESLGGELEILARFGDRTVRLRDV